MLDMENVRHLIEFSAQLAFVLALRSAPCVALHVYPRILTLAGGMRAWWDQRSGDVRCGFHSAPSCAVDLRPWKAHHGSELPRCLVDCLVPAIYSRALARRERYQYSSELYLLPRRRLEYRVL